jgi:hypothetical protein
MNGKTLTNLRSDVSIGPAGAWIIYPHGGG